MKKNTTKFVAIYHKIDTKEKAEKVLKESVLAFFFISFLMILAGFFLNKSYFIDFAIVAILAFFLFMTSSRIVAILFVLWATGGIVMTILNILGQTYGGTNIFLAIITLWIAIRTVQATFFLKSIVKTSHKTH